MKTSSTKELRLFIGKRFNDSELDTFCFDYFLEVKNDFTTGMRKNDKVMDLIQYCSNRGKLENLRVSLQQERGELYQQAFAPEQPLKQATQQLVYTPQPRNSKKVFVSHSSKDAELAQQIAADLQANGYEFFITPNSIQLGEKWAPAIDRALDECGIFLTLLTPHAVESGWVQSETYSAITMANANEARLFFLDVEQCKVPRSWSARQYVPFRGTDYKQNMRNLLYAFEGKQSPQKPVAKPQPDPELEKAAAERKVLPVDARHQQEARVKPLYAQLLQAQADGNWLSVLTLAAKIEVLLPNYRNVAGLQAVALQQLQKPQATPPSPVKAARSSANTFISIDFGTTRCSVAWYNPETKQSEILKNKEGDDHTPSIVYYGEQETLVGIYAEKMLYDPQEKHKVITNIKHGLVLARRIPIPGRRLQPREVVTEIFKKLKDDAEYLHFHKSVTRAVITYPAHFDDLQRDTIKEAGHAAGFEEIEMLQEPIAAVLAYQQGGLNLGQCVLVYALGGVVFDVAILTRDERSQFHLAMNPEGLNSVGGDDFDYALYGHLDDIVQNTLNRSIAIGQDTDINFLYECRNIKERLSNSEQVKVNILLPSKDGPPQKLQHTIKRSDFERLIESRIKATVLKTHRVLTIAKERNKIVDTVILIGGSSRIPLVTQELEKILPVSPKRWQRRDVAVALGAATYANRLWGLGKDINIPIKDSTEKRSFS